MTKSDLMSRIGLVVIPWVAAILLRLLYFSMRIDFIEDKSLRRSWDGGDNFLLICWHENILMMPKGYFGPGAKLLISRSKDGELLARAMSHFGYSAVRGSSSRGGKAALREMIALTRQNVDIAITPDGPRGPRRELKDGVLQLARVSGRGIVPVTFVCSRGRRFSSWDRFVCPYPFSRGVFSYGAPVYFDEEAGIDKFRERLISAMTINENQAKAKLESHGLSAI